MAKSGPHGNAYQDRVIGELHDGEAILAHLNGRALTALNAAPPFRSKAWLRPGGIKAATSFKAARNVSTMNSGVALDATCPEVLPLGSLR